LFGERAPNVNENIFKFEIDNTTVSFSFFHSLMIPRDIFPKNILSFVFFHKYFQTYFILFPDTISILIITFLRKYYSAMVSFFKHRVPVKRGSVILFSMPMFFKFSRVLHRKIRYNTITSRPRRPPLLRVETYLHDFSVLFSWRALVSVTFHW